MEQRIMDEYIDEFLEEYMDSYKRKKEGFSRSKILENLLTGKEDYSFKQLAYEDIDYLEENIRYSVRKYTRDKDAAIRVYKLFLEFLQTKGINVDVHFPPIPLSNTFERLMFIAKYIQDPEHRTDDLPGLLWQSKETIEKNLNKLRGKDKDPLQICGKVFKLTEKKQRSNGRIDLESTAHPLFLTPNLTQVIVMLKGLKVMSEDPNYANYAETIAADIWEQLSDYAKNRIHYVLSELLPEDLTWYENLEKPDKNLFYTERICSVPDNVLIDSIKNNKQFFVEMKDGKKYTNCSECRFVSATEVRFMSDQGEKIVSEENILRSAYTPEEFL